MATNFVDKTGLLYTVSKIKELLNNKANLASPILTGTPKAPTPTAGNNSTQIATTAFVTAAINGALANVSGLKLQVVSALPATGVTGTIYLKSKSGSSNDIYDEYIYIESKWELIGSTAVDLTGYMKEADLTVVSNSEIDAMFA